MSALGPLRPAPQRVMTKTIPFDYIFQFQLLGQPHNKVQDVVEISVEGIFVATAVGYSMVPDERVSPRFFEPVADPQTLPGAPAAVPLFEDGNGESLPSGLLVAGAPNTPYSLLASPPDTVVLESAVAAGGTGTGPREVRRGTIGPAGVNQESIEGMAENSLLQIWDRSRGLFSPLLRVGFNLAPVIGPDPVSGRLPAAGSRSVFVYGSASGGPVNLGRLSSSSEDVQPVGSEILLESLPTFGRTTFRAEVPLGDVPLAAGDLLLARGQSSEVGFTAFALPRPRPSTLSLEAVMRGLEKSGFDLTAGLRFNPQFANRLTADLPLDQIDPQVREKIFETGCVASEEVSFLYSIDVVSTGRELQSQPIHNIAGLGIANGDRPFRPFAKPVTLQPRSSVRIQIEELAARPGTLYIVLHGYKVLGTARIPE